MDKKGIVFSTTIKLVIAVICIGLLIMLMVGLAGVFRTRTIDQQAKGSLDNLMYEIEHLEDGVAKGFVLLTPTKWSLTGWPFEPVFRREQIPNDCVDNGWEKCVCLCEKDFLGTSGGTLDGCNTHGICREIKFDEFIVSRDYGGSEHRPIYIERLLGEGKLLELKKEGNKLTIYAKESS